MDTEMEDCAERKGGVCCCCLSQEDLQPMNLPEDENYEDMLKETFQITLDQFEKDRVMESLQICAACVMRLSDASDFKRQVQNTTKTLKSEFFKDPNTVTETEDIETEDVILVKEEMDMEDSSDSCVLIKSDMDSDDDESKNDCLNSESEDESSNSPSCCELSDNDDSETTAAKATKKKHQDFCLFCNKLVVDFMRHITTLHTEKRQVKAILSLPTSSPERGRLATKLRKKGYYIQNTLECANPMGRNDCKSTGLPCPTCPGFYSRSRLWIHRKICNESSDGRYTQAEAQNLLVTNLKIDSDLQKRVFPRMTNDDTSLVVKTDNLICALGSEYLKILKGTFSTHDVSQKMRELGKLIIAINELKPEITCLIDALKPEHYDVVVAATKSIGKYDHLAEQYSYPTYSTSISTLIKQCCNIGIQAMQSKILKREGDKIECAKIVDGLNSFIELINNNWKSDVFSLPANDKLFVPSMAALPIVAKQTVGNDLKKENVNECEKVTFVTLARGVKLLKEHLNNLAETAANNLLQNDFDERAYVDLLESVYCRVLLLNRRNHGELQELTLDTYLEGSESKDETFYESITATERILLQRFKIVFIRKSVPVLFSTNVQKDISILSAIREQYVDKQNQLLFANTKTFRGYNIFEKHAMLCCTKNPRILAFTSFRRYLATLSQIFAMSETDFEQLATYIGQMTGVRVQASDDIYQTAKIAKLLTLVEDGKADSLKGKSLDYIDLNVDEEIVGKSGEVNDNFQDVANINEQETTFEFVPITVQKHMPSTSASALVASSTRRPVFQSLSCVPWRPEQEDFVLKYFKTHIAQYVVPIKFDCQVLKEQHKELLENKGWRDIQVFIQNYFSNKRRS